MEQNEQKKEAMRKRMDGVILAIKVAKTTEEHKNPEAGDLLIEVMLEELMKLHSSYMHQELVLGCECTGKTEDCCCFGECDCECKTDTTSLTFSEALEAVKRGYRIARNGWNGRGQYVFLAKNLEFRTDADISRLAEAENGILVHDALAIKTAAEQIQVGWLASQSDMLADDWYVLD